MLAKPIPSGAERYYLDEGFVEVPLFPEDQMPSGYCARFARLSADYVFGKAYPAADAWKMRETEGVFTLPADENEIPKLAKSGVLVPGMLVGVHYKRSSFTSRDLPYTHLGLYLGEQNGKPVFLEQFCDEIRISRLSDYKKSEFEIREILGPKQTARI
jgi:hypothetical protein